VKKLPPAPWRDRDGLAALLDTLGARDGLTRIVGGAVRDTLIGLDVADIDCATALPPEEARDRIVAAGFKAVPTGIAHGTVTAVIPGGPVEVTTLRRDVSTDGRRATVAFTDDWREDAARRDFTINALSADPIGGEIYDYFDGLADLEAGRVRFIGDPLVRIAEDHLRILRFFRFHARFGRGDPDPAGLAACAARANDLMALSRERIADELLKLLGAPDIDGAGLSLLERLIRREQAAAVPPDALRRLAALLPPGEDVVGGVAMRLKLSNSARQRLKLATHRSQADSDDPKASAYRIGVDSTIDRILIGSERDGWETHLGALNGWVRPRLPISGGNLIALGLQAGPVVAGTLQAIERQWIDEGFPDAARVAVIADEQVAQALRRSR
jgi:poly(A) polymerase